MAYFQGERLPPLWALPVRLASALAVNAYVRGAYRVRGWGALPRSDEPALVISNHQIDLDLMAIVSTMALHGGWRAPFFSASARSLYEPGFLAMRVPWLSSLLHGVNFGWLFGGMGLLPIENELRARSLGRWAYGVQERHGALPLHEVFRREILERHGLSDLRTSDLFTRERFHLAQNARVRLSDLLPPHRKEQLELTCANAETDLQRIETLVRQGATFYVTPEGEYSRDGAMLPFRGIWPRLAPHAKRVYLAGISYDPFGGRRLSQLYRIVPLRERDRVVEELKASRPVTVSAMLASWLATSACRRFSAAEAVAGVRACARSVSARLFVDPDYRKHGDALVLRALARMHELGIVTEPAERMRMHPHRRHPQFPQVADIVAFQARFFAETLRAAGFAHTGEIEISSREEVTPAAR